MDLWAYTAPYRLLEEAREFWNYFVSYQVVYLLNPIKVALDVEKGIAKNYLEGHRWIECHITFQLGFKRERNVHYIILIKRCGFHDIRRELKAHNGTVHRNSHMLVDVAHFVETPEEVALYGIGSVIRLKRFDDTDCCCGDTIRPPLKFVRVGMVQNGEVSVLGIRQTELRRHQTS